MFQISLACSLWSIMVHQSGQSIIVLLTLWSTFVFHCDNIVGRNFLLFFSAIKDECSHIGISRATPPILGKEGSGDYAYNELFW